MLKDIKSPDDLKPLSIEELAALSDEIRREMISATLRQGGHLASSLGTVELCVAVHAVFDAPRDKIIFDVGHQAYAHKMLTGRAEMFKKLRSEGGASGFPRISESEYDAFTGGHASNAISAAIGMARVRDIEGAGNAVVAVVGDGAMTGGMCYEAMNDIGCGSGQLLVILNDNEMSISKSVGALSNYLNTLRESGFYRGAKHAIKKGLRRVPLIGQPFIRFIEAVKRAARFLLLRDQFFDTLGFEYFGPVDGHDIARLMKSLKRVKNIQKPVLLHVITQKGHGYEEAEARPDEYHMVSPSGAGSTNPQPRPAPNGETAARALAEMAGRDRRVAVITAAMPAGTGMVEFGKAFPDRFFDVGIAEGHAVTMAAGMAAAGARPYVAVYSTFLQRAYDQILHDVCIANLPVTLLIDRSGLIGADGCTHQGVFDLSYLRHMPNMTVASPRDPKDLVRLIELSAGVSGPMAIRYSREPCDMGGGIFTASDLFAIGEWEEMLGGSDAAILAVGQMVRTAMSAAIELVAHGVKCAVIDARFVKPMDEAMLLRAARKYPLLVTLEENAVCGGFGAGVMELLAARNASADVLALGVPDMFIEHASIDRQREMCGLSPYRVAMAVLARLSQNGKKQEENQCAHP